MKKGEKLGLMIEHRILCPFCGNDVQTGQTVDGKQAVLHTMPMCKEFDKLDPVEFLRRCNAVDVN